jgi:hypothetical protein
MSCSSWGARTFGSGTDFPAAVSRTVDRGALSFAHPNPSGDPAACCDSLMTRCPRQDGECRGLEITAVRQRKALRLRGSHNQGRVAPQRGPAFSVCNGKAWWQLIVILLTFAVTLIGVMLVAALLAHSISCAVLRRTVFRFLAISAAALAMHLLQISQRP